MCLSRSEVILMLTLYRESLYTVYVARRNEDMASYGIIKVTRVNEEDKLPMTLSFEDYAAYLIALGCFYDDENFTVVDNFYGYKLYEDGKSAYEDAKLFFR